MVDEARETPISPSKNDGIRTIYFHLARAMDEGRRPRSYISEKRPKSRDNRKRAS